MSEVLFVGLDTVFLRSDKVKECLGTGIELMEPSDRKSVV